MNNVLILIFVVLAVYMVCVRSQNQTTEPFCDNPLKMINHNEYTTPCCRNVYKVDQNREDMFSKNTSKVGSEVPLNKAVTLLAINSMQG